jgi:hypothetical protein
VVAARRPTTTARRLSHGLRAGALSVMSSDRVERLSFTCRYFTHFLSAIGKKRVGFVSLRLRIGLIGSHYGHSGLAWPVRSTACERAANPFLANRISRTVCSNEIPTRVNFGKQPSGTRTQKTSQNSVRGKDRLIKPDSGSIPTFGACAGIWTGWPPGPAAGLWLVALTRWRELEISGALSVQIGNRTCRGW